VLGVIAVCVLLSIASLRNWHYSPDDLMTLVVLVALATLSNVFKSLFKSQPTPEKGATFYSPSLIFIYAGALLLPNTYLVILVCIPQLIEWINERRKGSPLLKAWYIQPFNIATFILCGLAANFIFLQLRGAAAVTSNQGLLASMAAGVAFVILNHLMVAVVLLLARGVSLAQSELFTLNSLSPDVVMMALGYAIVIYWDLNPWLIFVALSPLWLLRQALQVMQLQKDASTDEKTGLLNARRFAELFRREFDRSHRFNRPLTLLFVDMDLLRNVNNTYGHLAGDKALAAIGKVVRTHTRDYDIAGRFGGEEFVVVLTETPPAIGARIAEAIRADIEHTLIEASPKAPAFRLTVSIGVACYPLDANSAGDLLEAADKAMYAAKYQGRNRVVTAFAHQAALRYEHEAHGNMLNEQEPVSMSQYEVA
jgi:diguanylate cyclase (GGDEF)-like protein